MNTRAALDSQEYVDLLGHEVVALIILEELVHLDNVGVILDTGNKRQAYRGRFRNDARLHLRCP